MPRCIVVCEGERDAQFVEEYFKQQELFVFKRCDDFKQLQRRARLSSSEILITAGGGVPKIFQRTAKLQRQPLGEKRNPPIILIADSDREPFKSLKTELENYVNTPCKAHNVQPLVNVMMDGHTLELKDGKSDRAVRVSVFAVPQNLEQQVAEAFKKKYPLQSENKNPKQIINEITDRYFGGDIRKTLAKAVELLAEREWLREIGKAVKNFCSSSKENFYHG
ncbi:MAG: hypothetical protein QXG69_00310 [Candidatus Caldarchaeum sp.]